MVSSSWILFFVALFFVATIDLWADPLNWLLRRLGSQGAGKPALPDLRRNVARVETPFAAAEHAGAFMGKVFYQGALWNARCAESLSGSLQPGDQVVVDSGQELTLEVIRKISC